MQYYDYETPRVCICIHLLLLVVAAESLGRVVVVS